MKTLMLSLLLLSTTSLACSFDSDCATGSSCSIAQGSLYGTCIDGLQPGNAHDKQPAHVYGEASSGNTCSYDTDCGVGGSCRHIGGGLYGVCYGGN